MDNPHRNMKEHIPSFCKKSSLGNHAFVETKCEHATEETD